MDSIHDHRPHALKPCGKKTHNLQTRQNRTCKTGPRKHIQTYDRSLSLPKRWGKLPQDQQHDPWQRTITTRQKLPHKFRSSSFKIKLCPNATSCSSWNHNQQCEPLTAQAARRHNECVRNSSNQICADRNTTMNYTPSTTSSSSNRSILTKYFFWGPPRPTPGRGRPNNNILTINIPCITAEIFRPYCILNQTELLWRTLQVHYLYLYKWW